MAKKRKVKKLPVQRSVSETPRTLSLVVRSLEIVRAYDGPFRGVPEPVLVVGLFETFAPSQATVASADILLKERRTISFKVNSEVPGVFGATEVAKVSARFAARSTACVALIALEEDNRAGVAASLSAFEHPETLSAWFPVNQVPDVHRLASLRPPGLEADSKAAPANVLVDSRALSDICDGDDFVGAAIVQWPIGSRQTSTVRAPFRSSDGKNEWCAVLEVSIR